MKSATCGRKSEERREARELAVDLARRIAESPSTPELEAEARELAKRYGDWVTDAIIDKLTGGNGTYSQTLQDRLNRNAQPHEITSNGSVPINLIDSIDALAAEISVIDTLNQLVAADYYRIRRSAKLKGIETTVWYRWLACYSAEMIARELSDAETFYDSVAVISMLKKICEKVANCEMLAWRTCYAQDLSRGNNSVPPTYISWQEIVLEARRHQ